MLLLASLWLLAGCGGGNQATRDATLAEFQQEQAELARVQEINEQLLAMAVSVPTEERLYRIGPDDQVKVEVFGVPELSRDYRVDANGNINMPLVGEVSVGGMTLSEAERAITEVYAEGFVRNPQVSLNVTEFRSQQFTAIGAVSSPRVYSTPRRITLLEALAMAGGLSREAGSKIYLTDRVRDPETGQYSNRSLIVSVDDLMANAGDHNLLLGDSAVINVPRAGSIFVEGAVERPGVYNRQPDTTVLRAIAMAGGLRFEASRSSIRVLRRIPGTDQWQEDSVSYNEIRDTPLADLQLNDGDIVMVEFGAIRTAWSGTMRTLRDIAFLGWRPLR